MNTQEQKNLIDLIDLLIIAHNHCAQEWGENSYYEDRLIEVIKPFNIGTPKFNDDGKASIDYCFVKNCTDSETLHNLVMDDLESSQSDKDCHKESIVRVTL